MKSRRLPPECWNRPTEPGSRDWLRSSGILEQTHLHDRLRDLAPRRDGPTRRIEARRLVAPPGRRPRRLRPLPANLLAQRRRPGLLLRPAECRRADGLDDLWQEYGVLR